MVAGLNAGDFQYLIICIIGIVIFVLVASFLPWEDNEDDTDHDSASKK